MRWSELNVPVLIHAFPDDEKNMTIKDRRDSFCGKMSHCNNLKQYGIKYTLTKSHTTDPESDDFRADLARFGAICRVVRGLKFARIGAIGARPQAFNTVRYSEKLLEKSGITVETLDLSEVFGRIDRLADDDASVTAKLAADRGLHPNQGRSGRVAAQDGQVRRRDRWLDAGDEPAGQRRPVLDLAGRELWRRTLHGHEHHEQRPHAGGVRDRHRRHRRHDGTGLCLGQALGHCRLEQQLRRRPRQGRALPLLQPAQGRFRRSARQLLQGRRHSRSWTTRRSSPARSAARTPTAR